MAALFQKCRDGDVMAAMVAVHLLMCVCSCQMWALGAGMNFAAFQRHFSKAFFFFFLIFAILIVT